MGDTVHHGEELLEVNFSISVLVDLGNGLVELILRVHVAELLTAEQLQKLA